MKQKEVFIEEIKKVTIASSLIDVKDSVELNNVRSMIVYPDKMRIELFDKKESHIGTLKYYDSLYWEEQFNGKERWLEIDSPGFFLVIDFEVKKEEAMKEDE